MSPSTLPAPKSHVSPTIPIPSFSLFQPLNKTLNKPKTPKNWAYKNFMLYLDTIPSFPKFRKKRQKNQIFRLKKEMPDSVTENRAGCHLKAAGDCFQNEAKWSVRRIYSRKPNDILRNQAVDWGICHIQTVYGLYNLLRRQTLWSTILPHDKASAIVAVRHSPGKPGSSESTLRIDQDSTAFASFRFERPSPGKTWFSPWSFSYLLRQRKKTKQHNADFTNFSFKTQL